MVFSPLCCVALATHTLDGTGRERLRHHAPYHVTGARENADGVSPSGIGLTLPRFPT